MLERLLLLWLTLLSLLAFFWASLLPTAWDPFLASDPYKGYMFAVTMLAIGSLLPQDEIRQVIKRWRAVLGGTAVQYASMPVLAYGLGHLFGLEDAWLWGVIVVGCVPGAMASNVLTLVSRGNVSYSVSLTTAATLLSPLVVPMVLTITLGRSVDFPTAEVSWRLCWMVVLPVVVGHTLSRRFPAWEAGARRAGGTVANLTILWIIAVVVATNRANLSQLQSGSGNRLLLALIALNLCGYLAGSFASVLLRLPAPMRRALTLEIGMQNAGLGTVLASDFFSEATAIAPAVYTFGCMFTGTILARLWAEFGGGEKKVESG